MYSFCVQKYFWHGSAAVDATCGSSIDFTTVQRTQL